MKKKCSFDDCVSRQIDDIIDLNLFFQTSDVFLNDSFLPDTPSDYEFFYRHTVTLTAVYCVAYVIVFLVGLIGNSFVIAVVLRSPKMRTTTNFFIVNLAMADILVIVFCLPATLMSNIFVREYKKTFYFIFTLHKSLNQITIIENCCTHRPK